MKINLLFLCLVLLLTLTAGAIIQGCGKAAESGSTSSATEETEFTLSGEAI
ncbi:MAG: hypothetical protein U1F27_07065 [Turneriella sp.]